MHFSATCDCGFEQEFEHGGNAGEIVGVGCQDCGRAYAVRLPAGVKQRRKLQKDTAPLRAAIIDAFCELQPRMTVRQVFYAMTVRGAVPKEDAGYRRVQNQLKAMREDGTIPYGWIADNVRWQIKPTSYTGLMSALEIFQQAYRRDLWARQAAHVEIWVEKDALAGGLNSTGKAVFGAEIHRVCIVVGKNRDFYHIEL